MLVLAGIQTAFAKYTSKVVQEEPENVSVLFNNGNVATGATTESGVAAPDGFLWSENQHDTGNTSEVNNIIGFGATVTANGNRLADNFTVPAGQTWRITSVSVLGYVSNWNAPQSPFSGGALQIWNGRPGDEGSTVVFGDTTTNRLISSTRSNIYVIRNTVVQPTNPSFNFSLWTNKLSVAPTFTLGPGTYWIDFQATSFNNAPVFFRNVVTPGARTQLSWNARQYYNATNNWQDVIDEGAPSSAPDVLQDIAFEINGFNTVPSGPTFMDYDGDGKTDLAVYYKTGTGSANLSAFWVLQDDGSYKVTPWGHGFDFSIASVRSY